MAERPIHSAVYLYVHCIHTYNSIILGYTLQYLRHLEIHVVYNFMRAAGHVKDGSKLARTITRDEVGWQGGR